MNLTKRLCRNTLPAWMSVYVAGETCVASAGREGVLGTTAVEAEYPRFVEFDSGFWLLCLRVNDWLREEEYVVASKALMNLGQYQKRALKRALFTHPFDHLHLRY